MARAGAKTGAKTAVGVRAQKPEVSKTHEEDCAGSDAAAEVKPLEEYNFIYVFKYGPTPFTQHTF